MSNTQPNQPTAANTQSKPQPGRPNEQGSIVVQAHMKIFDPVTKQIYVEGRA